MSKSGSRVGVIFISLICLVATITVAQSIFSSSPQAPAAAAPATPPMSANDFKNRVTQMNQQSNSALQSQAQSLMKAAPMPPGPGSAAGAGAQPQTVAAPPSTSSSTAPAGSSSQVYTGFGGDTGTQQPANGSSDGSSSGSSSSGSSSGGSDWNIKY